jgi:hypothetical protein
MILKVYQQKDVYQLYTQVGTAEVRKDYLYVFGDNQKEIACFPPGRWNFYEWVGSQPPVV